jgi:hypothetical protein
VRIEGIKISHFVLVQTCEFGNMAQGGQSGNCLFSNFQQIEHRCSSDIINKPSATSYAALFHDKPSCSTLNRRAQTQKAVTSGSNSDSVEAFINLSRQSSQQQPFPAAPQRLRIRRQSMRQETVALLAALDDIIHRPACHSREALKLPFDSNYQCHRK